MQGRGADSQRRAGPDGFQTVGAKLTKKRPLLLIKTRRVKTEDVIQAKRKDFRIGEKNNERQTFNEVPSSERKMKWWEKS